MQLGRTSRGWGLTIAIIVLSLGPTAFASEPDPQSAPSGTDAAAEIGQHFAGWTVSMERGTRDATYICGELPVRDRWSVVGCGSGAGFLYDPLPEEMDLAHFRAQYGISMAAAGLPAVELRPGVGLMEMQRGRDRPGFVFAPDRRRHLAEAAGPEAALEIEWAPTGETGPFRQFRLGWQTGAAWVPRAPAITGSPSQTVVFSTFSVNGRF